MRAVAALILIVAGGCQSPPAPAGANEGAARRGTEWLLARVGKGLPPLPAEWAHWEGDLTYNWGGNQTYTEIVLYTLLRAGVPRESPEIQRLLSAARQAFPNRVFGVALRALALRAYGGHEVRRDLFLCAQYLVDNQDPNGGWDMGIEIPTVEIPESLAAPRVAVKRRPGARGQNPPAFGVIYTHWAILGLAACRATGIDAPEECFSRAEKYLAARQNQDGGWGYDEKLKPQSYGTMTAGSAGALAVCLRASSRPVAGDERIRRASEWLAKNMKVDDRASKVLHHFQYYWIHALEMAGSLVGVERFGSRAWYDEGAAWLVEQQNADGSWGDGLDIYTGKKFERILDTCFALLFLRRATRHAP